MALGRLRRPSGPGRKGVGEVLVPLGPTAGTFWASMAVIVARLRPAADWGGGGRGAACSRGRRYVGL